MKVGRFLGQALAVLFSAGLAAGALGLEPGVPLAGGPAGGFYLEVARGVAAELPEVRAVETRGSVDNLTLLENGEVRFALAQQDVVSEHLLELQETGEPTKIRVVARVFFDYLHIFLRSPIHVEQADELRRFRIWPGDDQSGTRETAVRFL